MSFVYEGVVYTCTGFADSKTKNKHYNKHVQGKPKNAFGAGDMQHLSANIPDANAYQDFGKRFMNLSGTYHAQNFPIWTLETAQGNLARWDHNRGFFGVMTKTGTLLTFHMKLDASGFQKAVTEF